MNEEKLSYFKLDRIRIFQGNSLPRQRWRRRPQTQLLKTFLLPLVVSSWGFSLPRFSLSESFVVLTEAWERKRRNSIEQEEKWEEKGKISMKSHKVYFSYRSRFFQQIFSRFFFSFLFVDIHLRRKFFRNLIKYENEFHSWKVILRWWVEKSWILIGFVVGKKKKKNLFP